MASTLRAWSERPVAHTWTKQKRYHSKPRSTTPATATKTRRGHRRGRVAATGTTTGPPYGSVSSTGPSETVPSEATTGGSESGQGPLSAEHRERLEQRHADGPAEHGHAHRCLRLVEL